MSHTEAELVEDSNQRFEKHFGDLLVTGGKKHTFWGVNINIMEDKKVEIWIKEKLLEEIEAFGENIGEKVTTPASSHLFIVNQKAQKLDEEKSESFHLVVAKILYIMKRASPDLETEVSRSW